MKVPAVRQFALVLLAVIVGQWAAVAGERTETVELGAVPDGQGFKLLYQGLGLNLFNIQSSSVRGFAGQWGVGLFAGRHQFSRPMVLSAARGTHWSKVSMIVENYGRPVHVYAYRGQFAWPTNENRLGDLPPIPNNPEAFDNDASPLFSTNYPGTGGFNYGSKLLDRTLVPTKIEFTGIGPIDFVTIGEDTDGNYAPLIKSFTFTTDSSLSIRLHQVTDPYLIQNSSADADAPLILSGDAGRLSAQPAVSQGLVADGVTPLLVELSHVPTGTYRLSFNGASEAAVAGGLSKHLFIWQGGNFAQGDTVTVAADDASTFAYVSGIKSEDLDPTTFINNVVPVTLTVTPTQGSAEVPRVISFAIARPPIALVHGYNTVGTWGDSFKAELGLDRPDGFVKTMVYGVLDGNAHENTYDPLLECAGLLNVQLQSQMESSAAPLRSGWAYTRYDVVGHSQGGVLLRMLCTANQYVNLRPYRNSANFDRGRFRKIVTIGSPHNGSRLVHYISDLAFKGDIFSIIPTLLSPNNPFGACLGVDGTNQPKFDPWGMQIQRLNSLSSKGGCVPDPAAKFLLLRTTVAGGGPPKLLPVIPAYLLLGLDYPQGAVVLPHGADGVVDLDSQGREGFCNVATMNPCLNIPHSGPLALFAPPLSGSEADVDSFDVAFRIHDALCDIATSDHDTFGPFPTPLLLSDQERIALDEAAAKTTFEGFKIEFELLTVRATSSGSRSAKAAVGPGPLTLVFSGLDGQPLPGDVRWAADVFGTNGVTQDGVTLTVNPADSSSVTVSVAPSVVGDVVVSGHVPLANGGAGFAKALKVASIPPSAALKGIELDPATAQSASGASFPLHVWADYADGSRLLVFPDPAEVVFSSSNVKAVDVAPNGIVTLKIAGVATVKATYHGKSATAKLTTTSSITIADDLIAIPPSARDGQAIDVLANDLSNLGGGMTITSVTQGAAGRVEIVNDGTSLRYTPDSHFSEGDAFTYTLTDDAGNRSTATVRVEPRPPLYQAVDLSPLLPGNSSDSQSLGLNNAGQVAGYFYTYDSTLGAQFHPFVYWNQALQNLGALGSINGVPLAINDAGDLTGYFYPTSLLNEHAFIFANGSLEDIGVQSGYTDSYGAAVNRNHLVVGISVVNTSGMDYGHARAFSYVGGQRRLLANLGGNVSRALAVNSHGTVVGDASLSGDMITHAYSITAGRIKDLGTLGGPYSGASAVNDAGEIAGSANTADDPTRHLFLYSGGKMRDLGTFAGHDTDAVSLNERGLLLGAYDDQTHGPALPFPFLMRGGSKYDLLGLTSGLPGLSSLYAGINSLNDWGQIAAAGIVNYQERAVLLNPVTPYFTTSGNTVDTRLVAGMNYSLFTPFTRTGGLASTFQLLGGTAALNRDVLVELTSRPSAALRSDVASLEGTGDDTFVVQLSYDQPGTGAEEELRLVWLDPVSRQWINAVAGNSAGTSTFIDGPYDPALHFHLGYHGVDAVHGQVWAVLQHGGKFAAASHDSLFGVGASGYAAQAGIYKAILNGGNGSFSMTLGRGGVATGLLVLDGATYRLKGKFVDGAFVGTSAPAIPVSLTLSGRAGASTLTGSVNGVSLTAWHAVVPTGGALAQAGKFTLLLEPTGSGATVPAGTGYATITVTVAGGVKMAGQLADGTPFSYAGPLVGGADGQVHLPLYATPYRTGGSLISDLIFANADSFSGSVHWQKTPLPANLASKPYAGGIDLSLHATGDRYTAPHAGESVLAFPAVDNDAEVVFSGGGLVSGSSELVTLRAGNQVRVPAADALKLSVRLTPASGLMTGSFLHPVTHLPAAFHGVLSQTRNLGEGYFLSAGVSGAVVFEKNPH